MNKNRCSEAKEFHRNCFDEDEYEMTQDRTKCILHCKKDNWNDTKKIEKFWEKLNSEISNVNVQSEVSKDTRKAVEKESNSKLIKYEFNNIIFPTFETTKGRLEDRPFFGLNEEIDIEFNNCNFLSDVDFSLLDRAKDIKFKNCKFYDDVTFKSLSYNGLFLFEECTLLKSLIFQNVTFFDTVSFIQTKVKNKSDFIHTKFQSLALFGSFESNNFILDNTFFKVGISFLHAKVNISDRETARIIKDSFEQQNNIIEANKFYALEMEEREKELNKERKLGKNILDWIIFKVHKHSSNHSQDWSLALFWIMIIGFISSYCDFNFAKVNETYIHFDILNIFKTLGLISLMFILSYICEVKDKIVNGIYYLVCTYLIYIYSTEDYLLTLFAKAVNPTTVLKSNDPVNGIQLIFKIIIAYLIYQLVVSIRQNTRRK